MIHRLRFLFPLVSDSFHFDSHGSQALRNVFIVVWPAVQLTASFTSQSSETFHDSVRELWRQFL